MGHKHKKNSASKASRYAKILANKREKMQKHINNHPNDKQTLKRLNNEK